MKKLFLLFAFILCNLFSFSQTVTPHSGASSASLQAVEINTLLATKVITDSVRNNTQSIELYTKQQNILQTDNNATLTIIKQKQDSILQNQRVQDAFLSEIQYLSQVNNRKWDSSLASTNTFTVMTYTAVSTNTGSATTANTCIGTGAFTLTLPTGTWQILSAICTESLVSATFTARLMIFNGGSANIPTSSEGNVITFTSAMMAEWKDGFQATTAYGQTFGSLGALYFQQYNNPTVMQGFGMHTGDMKCVFMYNSTFTPPANNQYLLRIRMKRIY